MDVVLKKVKVTKSVIAQSLLGQNYLLFGHPNYDILGWCYFIAGKNSRRYILLYDKADHVIVKLHYIKDADIEIISKGEQTRKPGVPYEDWYWPTFHSLKIRAEVNRSNEVTIAKSEELTDVEEKKEKLLSFLKEVNQKGQIYI